MLLLNKNKLIKIHSTARPSRQILISIIFKHLHQTLPRKTQAVKLPLFVLNLSWKDG